MRFDIVTIFPDIFTGYLKESILEKAIKKGLVTVNLHNLRDCSEDKHDGVDDRPFGGGPGMVLKVGPIVRCVEQIAAEASGEDTEPKPKNAPKVILFTPRGTKLTQRKVEQIAQNDHIIAVCGRYEGFDQRVIDILKPEEISIGDYVLNGGEVAAMVLIDTTIRLLPDVLGCQESHHDDSFSTGNRLLESSQYTRPRSFRGHEVPEVLLSGDHQKIAQWRLENSKKITEKRRADLLKDELASDE
ncbi:MAG: tRNA (guanosine(37)-N1)-methyltransferase TrmD [Pirellulaceae bacterium]|nr:tRNA (guanosine(37)-N1)-methyltransferase TrmD [Pirellulaceae bacterium]